jgi:hypothetical protein
MDHEKRFETPEDAAAGSVGAPLEVDASADGRWAVVIGGRRQSLRFALCKAAKGSWGFGDDGEMTPTRENVRSTWISLVDFDVEDGPNVGVEITWGAAPPEATRAKLGRGEQELTAPVHEGAYWFIRWQVLDDDDDEKVIRFASG